MVLDDDLKILRFVPSLLFPPGNIFLSLFRLKSDDEIEVKKMKGASLVLPRKRKENLPLIIYFHGGAYVYKAAPYHYRNVKEYVLKADAAVLMVDYSLSPKNKYPRAVEEGLGWYKKYSSLRPALMGDSAGGEIALSVTMRIIEEKMALPRFLMLLYPVVAPVETESKRKYTSAPVWNSRLNEKMWRLYLGKEKYRSIFDFSSLASFPPTYIESAEFDPLRDEAEMLSNRLTSSGVDCDYFPVPGTPHGYDMVRSAAVVSEMMERRLEYIKRRSGN